MSYTMWTGKDLELYNSYLKNIEVEQVGFINIGGIFETSDFFKEHKMAAYIFRIYDSNVNCPDRQTNIGGPGVQWMFDGRVAGLVVALAKDPERESFFFENERVDSNKVFIIHPASIWIATYYTGACQSIGKQVVYEHQGAFLASCCTHLSNGQQEAALSKKHMLEIILPNVAEAYKEEILQEDMKKGYLF